ncbi:hypothetical protein [Luteimonas sp. A482]
MKTDSATQDIRQIVSRAIPPAAVKPDGPLTTPRSYGVYEVPAATAARRFRFGNHPVRMQELERELGSCRLMYLFRQREDAAAIAAALNVGVPMQ